MTIIDTRPPGQRPDEVATPRAGHGPPPPDPDPPDPPDPPNPPVAGPEAPGSIYDYVSGQQYRLRNATPYAIRITPEDPAEFEEFGELVVPPFGDRIVAEERLRPFKEQIRLHRQRHELRVRPFDAEPSGIWSRRMIRAMWIALLSVSVVAVADGVTFGTLRRWEMSVAGLVALLAVILGLTAAHRLESARKAGERLADQCEGDTEHALGGAYSTGDETLRRFSHVSTLAIVLLIGALLPTIAIIVGTETKDFLSFEGGLRVLPDHESKFVARVIQMIYTAVLSLFPALLFFQFDRHRVGTIRDYWIRSIFRMDGRLRTMADFNAYYGRELSEASNNSTDSVRLLGGKHSPVVVATILITLGWTIMVLRTESYDPSANAAATQVAKEAEDFADAATEAADAAEGGDPVSVVEAEALAEAARDAATEAREQTEVVAAASDGEPIDSAATTVAPSTSVPAAGGELTEDTNTGGEPNGTGAGSQGDGSGIAAADELAAEARAEARLASIEAENIQSTSFFQLLAPQPSPSSMAFLGAYFFGVYLVLRSYFRGDLRPKVYNQITARLVTVVVVAYVINVMWPETLGDSRVVWTMAFIGGVVPTTTLRRIFLMAGSGARSYGSWRSRRRQRKSPGAGNSKPSGNGDQEQWTSEAIREAFPRSRPLTQIDGIDLYDASRLESEGITDVPALADGRLASVMVNTRLPIGRLVDWADQASLMVVLSSGDPEKLDPRIIALRTYGVRTGTDFLETYESGCERSIADLEAILQLPPAVPWPRATVPFPASRDANGNGNGANGNGATTDDADATADANANGNGNGNGANGNGANGNGASGSAPEPTMAGARPVMCVKAVCDAIRRQRVMVDVMQWRNSPFADVDEPFIALPELRYRELPQRHTEVGVLAGSDR